MRTLVSLERGYTSGVKSENYSTDPARSGFYAANWMGLSLVLTRTVISNANRQSSVANGGQHQEIWTMLPGDILNVDVTDRATASAPPGTTHLTCARLLLRDAIVRGQNLVESGDAASFVGWQAWGDATIERVADNPCFVLRNGGRLNQTVLLPPSASSKFVVLIGSGAT